MGMLMQRETNEQGHMTSAFADCTEASHMFKPKQQRIIFVCRLSEVRLMKPERDSEDQRTVLLQVCLTFLL